ncbi:GRF1-interacting factor [Orobanche minor]
MMEEENFVEGAFTCDDFQKRISSRIEKQVLTTFVQKDEGTLYPNEFSVFLDKTYTKLDYPHHDYGQQMFFSGWGPTSRERKKYLDENKKLILAILDNQHLGKLAECAQYQAQLQKNLMYLAAIADAQPQTPAMPAQMSPQPAAMPTQPQGGFYMQHPHAAAMAQPPPHHHPPPVGHNNGNTTNLGGGMASSDAVGDETTN